MGLKRANRIKDQTTTTGTGTLTLGGAQTGYLAVGSGYSNGDRGLFVIQGTTEWELSYGTYTSSGTTLSRDQVVASSNSGSLVNFSAGSKDVFPAPDAADGNAADAGMYGAGTDGNVTISSGTTTLTRDMYYNTLTMTGGKINPAGYRIFVNDTFDISGYTTGGPAIERLAGTAAGVTVGVGSAAVAGGAGGYVTVSATGYQGGDGTAGGAITGNGGAGGASGAGGNGQAHDYSPITDPGYLAGTSGAAGTLTAIPIYRRIPYLTSGPSTLIVGGGRGASGGGGGAGAGNPIGKEPLHSATGGIGGTGGTGGGVLDMVCKIFKTSGSNPAGLITASGGAASAGATGVNGGGVPTAYSGGGGGGAGGGGGWIFFCYAIRNGTGVSNLFNANGGAGANGGNSGGGTAVVGNGGAGGSGGRISLFNLATNVITETTGSAGSAASGQTGGAGNSFGATV